MPLRLLDRRAVRSAPPVIVCVMLCMAGVAWAFVWTAEAPHNHRKQLLAWIVAVFLIRFAFMLLILVPRCLPWWEACCTGVGMLFLPAALVRAASPEALSWQDCPALLVHVLGSSVTSISEWQRYLWKPTHPGKLYVTGLFGVAKHVNYSGEVLTFIGWVALTLVPVTTLLPACFFLVLRFVYAPDLDRYLADRYRADACLVRWQRLPSMIPSGFRADATFSASTAAAVVVVAALTLMALTRTLVAGQ